MRPTTRNKEVAMRRIAKKRLTLTAEPVEATVRTPLTTHWNVEPPWYIAVHHNGYGAHRDPAQAILLAQESVPMKAKRSQLLIYRHYEEVEPTGFGTWPDGVQPALVGLTNTHQGWIRRQ
jgi:hypothetical protein